MLASPKSSNSSSSSGSNSSGGSSSAFPYSGLVGAALSPAITAANEAATKAAYKATYENPNKNYEGYAQDILNGKITSGTTYDQWANQKDSYPGGGLNYGGSNGSVVPTYDLYKNVGQNTANTTNTFDVAAALRQAQAQTDANLKQQQDLANQQADANRTSQLARLRSAYDTQRADINSQIPELQQTAQQALTQNETDYYNKYKPQMLAAMEQSGGYKGGQMVDGMQGLITALQNNQNNVNTAKLQQEAKLRQALANLNTQQASDETQVNSNIDASTYDKLMGALKDSQQQKLSLDDMYTNKAYQQAMFGLNQQAQDNSKYAQDQNIALQRMQVTGKAEPYPGLQINQSVYDMINKNYNGDWQAAINDVSSGKLSQELLPSLQEGRYQKVSSNPALEQQYGDQYLTPAARAQSIQDQVSALKAQYDMKMIPAEYQSKMDQIALEAKYDPMKAQYELQTLAANLDKIKSDTALNYAQANAAGTKASGAASTAGQLTYKDYYTDLNAMLGQGTYVDVKGPDGTATGQKTWVPRYSTDDVLARVKSLPLDLESKAKLLSDLNIPKP